MSSENPNAVAPRARPLRACFHVFAVFFLGGMFFVAMVPWLAWLGYTLVSAVMSHEHASLTLASLGELLSYITLSVAVEILPITWRPQLASAFAAVILLVAFRRVPLIAVLLLTPLIGLVADFSLSEFGRLPAAKPLREWSVFAIFTALQVPASLICWWLVRRVSLPARHPLPEGARPS
jgi:hypothetical protein